MSRRARRVAVGIVAFVLTGIVAQAAFAAWLETGNGTGAARARELALTGNVPTVGASGGDVTVSWAQSTFVSAFLGTYSGGGYRVRRYDTGGTVQTVQAACNVVVSGSAATLSCMEHAVPTGTWRYGVTPVLGAWSGTESTRTQVVVDAPPALVTLEMFDNNTNGKVDQVKATFSEALATYTAGTTPWTLANVPSAGTLASVSVSGTVATLTVTEGAGTVNTAVGSFTVALAANATGIRDAAGNQSSFAATAPTDKAAPVRTALDMKDVNANGKVDQVVATFSESLGSYSAGTTPWTLVNVPSSGTLSSVSINGTTATLALTEGAGAANTALGSFTVAMTANASGVRDAAGNPASTVAATAPADIAAPVRTALDMKDVNGNGKVDQVVATFSEALAATTATAPWTLANVPSGGSLSSVSRSGTTATLTLTEGATAADTAVGGFTLALAANATGIRDTAGNQSAFAATAPADVAGPVAVSMTSVNVGATAGRLESGDYLEVTFSELLSPTWASPASVTVRITGGNGSNEDKLNVPNLFSGALNMGSSAYVSGNGTTADFASTLTLVSGSTAVRVTLGTCSGGCASLTTAGPGAFTFTPATAIEDDAGNAPTGTLATAGTFRFF